MIEVARTRFLFAGFGRIIRVRMKTTDLTSPAPTAPAPAVTAEGETFPSDPRRLRYAGVAPRGGESGESVEMAQGVRWARIPLPVDLNHINVWLVDTPDGCIVVDTGMAASMGKDAWEAI